MSLLPLLFDCYEPWQRHGLAAGQPRRPHHHHYPDFDMLDEFNMYPSIPDILSIVPRRNDVIRRATGSDSINQPSAPIVGKNGFKVLMDVKQFKPNEITVKIIDNHIVIEGKHEEREDEHGHIYRHFNRKYMLPKGYDANDVSSTLSSDGILTIKAPPPQNQIEATERIIEIIQTVGGGPEAVKNGTNGEAATNNKEEEEPMQVENGNK